MARPLTPSDLISPWRRYFARMIDLFLMALLSYSGIELMKSRGLLNPIAAFASLNPLLFDAAVCLVWIGVEYGLLRGLGNTPGKALLNLRIKPTRSQGNLLSRGFSVWFWGMGAGLPLLTQLCNLAAHFRLHNRGITRWDTNHGFEVVGNPLTGWRKGLTALLLLAGIGFVTVQQVRWNEIQPMHEALVNSLNEGRYAAFMVEDYYQQHGKMPADLGGLISPDHISQGTQLSIDRNSGTLHIRPTLSGIQTHRLFLIPHPTSDKKLIWECRSDEFPIEYLPAGCEFKPYAQARAEVSGALPTPVKPQPRRSSALPDRRAPGIGDQRVDTAAGQ